jgi:hypothetical protein
MAKEEEHLLDVDVFLKPMVSVFRFDMSDTALVITKEDPKEPALRSRHHSYFYDAFREDMRLSQRQGRQLPREEPGVRRTALSRDSVRDLLLRLGFDATPLTDDLVDSVVAVAHDPRDPYG